MPTFIVETREQRKAWWMTREIEDVLLTLECLDAKSTDAEILREVVNEKKVL